MAVKKTQMYRRQLDGTETDLNPLTESQYVLMENGQTVQEVLSDRDSDKYTPVITNSSSTFKVGQGDNVDLSSSMKEGAYDSCVLKGKTMVNCIQEPSSQDVVLPYEFADGQYVTINDTKESGALGVELKGQTLVNLFNTKDIVGLNGEMTIEKGVITLPIKNHRYNNFNIPKSKCTMFKPSTKYTMWVNMLENRSEDNEGETQQSGSFWLQTYDYSSSIVKTSNQGTYGCRFENNEVGVKTCVFETHAQNEYDSKSGGLNFDLPCYYAKNGGIQRVSIVIMEGDWSNQELPFDKFFTGMTSCKMPILSTTGKNLLPSIKNTWYPCRFKQGTTFKLSTRDSVPSNGGNVVFKDINGASVWFGIDSGNTTSTKVLPCDVYYIMNSLATGVEHQLEIGTQVTSYEPNKTSILSLPEEVVLRSLPNGVCDTFNTRTGVYTQRIGEVVLDGSENWSDYSTPSGGDDYISFSVTTPKLSNRKVGFTNSLCDGMKIGTSTAIIDEFIEPHPSDPSMNGWVMIRILKTRLSAQTVQGLREWLTNNPLTLQYELIAPIVTKINLPSTLKSWNTTTHIYSEIPENTLYPILSHSNPTYPVILKPSTKYSIVANSYSNDHTNSAINFNLGGATASTTVGNRVTTITTPSTLSNELLTMSGRGNKLSNVMVIEGDVMGDEPYFEGICDCKSPILSNVGKNLFDEQRHSNPDNFFVFSSYWSIPIRLKGNTEYRFSYTFNNVLDKQVVMRFATCKWTSTEHSSHPYSLGQVFNKNITSNLMGKTESMSFVTPADGLVYLHYYNTELTNSPSSFNLASWYTHILKDIHLEESSTSTQYESYKSNTTTFNQKDDKTIVLRSLPSGVCDTLNVETGEYVQRIGEAILNGSQGVSSWWNTTSTIGVGIPIPTMKNISKLNCDKLPVVSYGAINNDTYDKDGIASWDTGNIIRFRIEKSKLTTEDVDGVKQYLQQNPITIQYELINPIVSTIDVQGFPYAYKDGHVQLSSGHSGQSLTPKVEYSLSANKTGQIQSNTRQVIRQQNKLDDLEALMLTAMIQSLYDKTLLEFEYEMTLGMM